MTWPNSHRPAIFRRLTDRDAAGVAFLRRRLGLRPLDPSFHNTTRSANAPEAAPCRWLRLGAFIDGCLAGYVAAALPGRNPEGGEQPVELGRRSCASSREIDSIVIHPAHHRHGVGAALIWATLLDVDRLGCQRAWTIISPDDAHGLSVMLGCGFVVTAMEFERNRQARLVLWRDLTRCRIWVRPPVVDVPLRDHDSVAGALYRGLVGVAVSWQSAGAALKMAARCRAGNRTDITTSPIKTYSTAQLAHFGRHVGLRRRAS